MSAALHQWLKVSSMELQDLTPIVPFDVHCIGGIGQATLTSAIIDGNLTPQAKWKPLYADGDEYVLTKSMRRCLQLARFTSGRFTFKNFSLDHMQLIQHKTSIDYILDIINDANGKRVK